jgi:ankyrin repeat protein
MKLVKFSLIALCMPALLAAAGDFRLIEASKRGDIKAVRALLSQHVPVNAAAADGSTALHEAARFDRLEIADLLLNSGADVKAITR